VLAVVVLLGAVLGWWVSQRSDGPVTSSASAAVLAPSAEARDTPDSGLASVAESRLPSQARGTLALIRAGGPFPYAKDGTVFENRERILPGQAGGYYREYTVAKPGESDRGPWRLVVGRGGDVYWTSNHYDSFQRVQEGT
jgi:ribonuclease T1